MTGDEYLLRLARACVAGVMPGYVPTVEYLGRPRCRYKVGDKKCAFGILIPDEDYCPVWDQKTTSVEEISSKLLHVDLPSQSLAYEAQRAHDLTAYAGWNTREFFARLFREPCWSSAVTPAGLAAAQAVLGFNLLSEEN